MKSFNKVIGLTIIAIISFWLIDIIVDITVHYDDTFLDSLTNEKENAFRSLFSVCILIFGLFMAKIIDRQKSVEEKLRASERLFRVAFESAGFGASMADLKGRFVRVNQRLCDMLGYSEEEMLSKTFSDVTHPDDVQIGMDAAKKLVSGEADYTSFEKRYVRKDGGLIYVHISPSIIRSGDGKPLYFVALFNDITARKITEDLLSKSEEKYRNLFESADDAIFILDLEGNFIDVNSTAYTRLGYTKEELLSMHVSQLDPPEFASRVPERLALIREHGSAVFESAHVKKDGTVMPVEINARLLDYEGRKVYLSLIRDITERKEAEALIKASLREKDVLLQEVHHRVKNNMQVISSLLNLQARYIDDEGTSRLFNEIRNRIRSMALIHEKLYMSKNLSSISFKSYVESLVKNLQVSFGDRTGRVKVNVHMDETQMNTDTAIPCGLIVNELVSNAFKYAFPDGKEGEIIVALKRSDSGGFVLTVADNGIGIPAEVDFRNSNSLGFVLVALLVEKQLGGSVDMKTENGTEFEIDFKELQYAKRV